MRLEGLYKIFSELWMLQKILTDFLEYLPDFFGIRSEGDREPEFHDDPVPRIIRELRDFAVRNCVQKATMMTQPERADRNPLNRAHRSANVEVLTDAIGIIEQEEDARYNIRDEFLRSETDGQPKDTGACKKWRNIYAKFAEREQTKQNDDVLIMGYPQNPHLEGSSTGIVLSQFC